MLDPQAILTTVRRRVQAECPAQPRLSCQAVILAEELVAAINAQQQARASRMARPELPEVELHFAKIGLPQSEAVKFIAYFEANGWKVGRNPMKSWQHAATTWKMNWQQRQGKAAGQIDGAMRVQLNKELEETQRKMDAIKGTYSGMMSWTSPDRARFNQLKSRKAELKERLHL